MVIPESKINLVSGAMEAISFFLKTYHLNWSIPIIAFLVAFGALGSMSTWTVGPSKGLLAAAKDGDFPPILHKVNKNQMPIAMLTFQGIIVSILSLVFLLMPNVSSSFWILLALSSQLYLLMYLLLFSSSIFLRYKRPDVPRAYKVPGGKIGIWITAGIGFSASLFAIIVGFFPPEQLDTGSALFYILFLLIGMIFFSAAPFLILLFKKPSWDQASLSRDDAKQGAKK